MTDTMARERGIWARKQTCNMHQATLARSTCQLETWFSHCRAHPWAFATAKSTSANCSARLVRLTTRRAWPSEFAAGPEARKSKTKHAMRSKATGTRQERARPNMTSEARPQDMPCQDRTGQTPLAPQSLLQI